MTDPLMTVPAHARSGVWLVVDFFVKPDRVDDARRLFARHVADGRGDTGNLLFIALNDADDPTRFTTVEAWEDAPAIAAHDDTAHHARFLRGLREMQTREKQVRTLHYHPSTPSTPADAGR